MSKTPAERLKELREKRFSTAKEAADAFGWNEVTYRSHESGGRNIPLHTARKYATAFGSNAGHILGLNNNPAPATSVNHTINVPLVGRVSAGSFKFEEALQARGVAVPAVPRPDIPAGMQYALEVDGPSVNLRIPDGAFAICAPLGNYPGHPKHGQLVHVVRERAGLFESTIKELHYTREGMVLMPCSSDPAFQEVVKVDSPEPDTMVSIKGIVIGSFQPF
jgi:SOS-response transcriptional repressor LexA